VLRTRIATALVLLPLVLAALFLLPPGGWGAAALAVMLVAAHEWGRLAGFGLRAHLLFVLGVLGLGVALLYAPGAALAHGWPPAIVVAACGLGSLFWLALAPVWIVRQWPTTRRLPMLLAGWVVLVGAWVALVELQARSPWLVLAAMAIVWIADTAAYFSGRAFGRTKLAPLISPGKTWEGVYGAFAAVALYALLLVPFARDAGYVSAIGVPQIAAWFGIVLLVAGVSILGDLFESLQKRQAGVKDSGTLLPGHGGILDRIDALLAAMPLSALAAQLFLDRH